MTRGFPSRTWSSTRRPARRTCLAGTSCEQGPPPKRTHRTSCRVRTPRLCCAHLLITRALEVHKCSLRTLSCLTRPFAPLKITIRSRPTSTFLLEPLTTYGSSCLIRPADISTTPIFARTQMRREWARGSAASRKFSNSRALSRNADVTPLDAVRSVASGRSVEGCAEARSSSARRTASSRAGRSIKRRTNVERGRPLSVGLEILRKPHPNFATASLCLYTANRAQPRINAKCQRGTSINASAVSLTKPALSGRCTGATAPQHSRLASE
jgi:hypothetical protein